jgi:ABC-type Fe3+-hydroxamate transport system substrate-binding protein
VIVVAMMHKEDWEAIDPAEVFEGKPGWSDLSAVHGGRVYKINPDKAVRAGPRLFDAMEQMAQILQDAVGGEPSDG